MPEFYSEEGARHVPGLWPKLVKGYICEGLFSIGTSNCEVGTPNSIVNMLLCPHLVVRHAQDWATNGDENSPMKRCYEIHKAL